MSGDSGYGKWLGTGTALAEPYPCRCDEDDPDPPKWKLDQAKRAAGHSSPPPVGRCDPWRQAKGANTGRWTNRCPCWGQKPSSEDPGGCCRAHPGNPALATWSPGAGWAYGDERRPSVVSDGDAPDLGNQFEGPSEGRGRVDPLFASPSSGAGVNVRLDCVPDASRGRPVVEVELPADDGPPVGRRWSASELHCPCPTPWDTPAGAKPIRSAGVHCVSCHCNWVNLGAASAHQRRVTDPCRDPRKIVDVDTGKALMAVRIVGDHQVWGFNYGE